MLLCKKENYNYYKDLLEGKEGRERKKGEEKRRRKKGIDLPVLYIIYKYAYTGVRI